ncbi:MAG TPA: hypothetical protein VKY74_07970 [Chloroflexia bacterium]|nr:hypothetical protein [Chloroflexia bacterium]
MAATRRPWARRIGGAVGLLALLAWPGAGRAAPIEPAAGLTMTVQAGYAGHYKLGAWFPVQVTLSNTGQSFDAEVQVDATGGGDQVVATYSRQVPLPAPARKVVTLYTYATAYQHELTVRLLRGSTIVLEQKTPINPLADAFLLGVVSDSPDLLNFLSGTTLGRGPTPGQATVAHLQPADLPGSAAALGGLDALVFAGSDTGQLSTDQRQALAGWAVRGGTMVVAGGPSGPTTAAGLTDLLPVDMGGAQSIASLDDLGRYAGAAPPATGVLVSAMHLRPETGAHSLATAGGIPLLVRRPLGAGEVFALGLDPAAAPLKSWDHAPAFWKQLFADHQTSRGAGTSLQAGGPSYTPGSYYISQLSPFDIPALQLPGVGLVGGFLFLYVLVVGPINYLLLRRGRRQDLAWLTIPAIILGFAGLAYVIGYSSKGDQLRLTTVSIVRAYAGAPVAAIESFAGIFSPTRQAYELQIAEDSQISEVNGRGGLQAAQAGGPGTIYQGKPSGIAGLQIDTWSLRGFLAETTVPYSAPYAAQLRLDGGMISGQVSNRGSVTLQDVAVVFANDTQIVGTLAPGQTVAVRFPETGTGAQDLEILLPQLVSGLQLHSYPQSSTAADRARQRRAAALSTVLEEDQSVATGLDAVIVGWGAPLPVQIALPGQSPVRDDLVLVTEQIAVDTPSGRILVRLAQIPRTIISGYPNTFPTGYNQPTSIMLNGDVTFQYQLPKDVQIDRLTLSYAQGSQYRNSRLHFAIFNWSTGNWDEVRDSSGTAVGSALTYTGNIAGPAAYIDKEGQVRLRVQPMPGSGQTGIYMYIHRLDLSAEGQR